MSGIPTVPREVSHGLERKLQVSHHSPHLLWPQTCNIVSIDGKDDRMTWWFVQTWLHETIGTKSRVLLQEILSLHSCPPPGSELLFPSGGRRGSGSGGGFCAMLEDPKFLRHESCPRGNGLKKRAVGTKSRVLQQEIRSLHCCPPPGPELLFSF